MKFKSRINFKSESKRAKWILNVTGVLAAINFFAFILGSLYLGGDAQNGYIASGHYFVCAHGSCSQVSREAWNYSYWHGVASLWGIALVFVEAAIFVNTGDIVIDWDKA